ncbi:hypothetical protein GCM10020331_051370 [Ectobacillus funiculus]
MITMIVLKRADFFAPCVNRNVITKKTIKIAGKSINVPFSGLYALVKAVGKWIPKPASNPWK